RVRQFQAGPVEPFRLGEHAVLADLHVGAHRAQRVHVEVDRPPPDRVAADQRHERLPRQVEQRAEHEDRNAVQPGERVGHPGPDLRPALDPDLRLADLDVDAERLQHGRGYADLAHIRGVLDAALPVAQHGGDHVLGNRVLRPPDHDVAAKRARGFYHPDLLFNHEVSLTGRYHRSGPATIEGAWRDEGST